MKNEKFTPWNKEDEIIKENILNDIEKQTLLTYPNYTQDFQLYTDACDYAIGSILKQSDKIIGIYSNKLKESELNYITTEKEIYAIIISLNHFRTIGLGSKIYVFTDNKNIIFNKNLNNKRIEKWKLTLLECDTELIHIEDHKNSGVDVLSGCFNLSNVDYELKTEKIINLQIKNKIGEDEIKNKNFHTVQLKVKKIIVEQRKRIIFPENQQKVL